MRLSIWMLVILTCLLSIACREDPGHRVLSDSARVACEREELPRALTGWFRVVESGDAGAIGRVVDRRNFHWVSVSSFGKGDSSVAVRAYDSLETYVRRRASAHERLRLIDVTTSEQRGELVEFGPVWVERSADELPPGAHRGVGKGEYHCGAGLTVLSLAPDMR